MRIVVIVFALCFTPPILAQGLVNFANTPNTLVSAQGLVFSNFQKTVSIMSGQRGSYYFALLVGTPGNFDFTFTGFYATNTGVDGLFSGGTVASFDWAPGTSRSYIVAGWSADLGTTFSPAWLSKPPDGGDFGLSAYGIGTAGNGTTIPILNLFDGGDNTISMGFTLSNKLIPEPSTASLIAIGAGVSLLYRDRRKSKGWSVRLRNASEPAGKQ